MSCTTSDLPAVTAIAQKAIVAEGLEARVAAGSGDFFADPLPQANVVTMGMILHDWDLRRTKKELVRKAYAALPEGGALVAIEALIDDARRANTFGLMMSLNMLIEFGNAFDFTGAEFRSWCEEAGSRRTLERSGRLQVGPGCFRWVGPPRRRRPYVIAAMAGDEDCNGLAIIVASTKRQGDPWCAAGAAARHLGEKQ